MSAPRPPEALRVEKCSDRAYPYELMDAEDAPVARFVSRADAERHAALPELLAALKSAKWMLERDRIDEQKLRVIERCDAAIAKVTKEQP